MAEEGTRGGECSNRLYEPLLCKRVIGWFLCQLVYTFLGALLFILLEECHGNNAITDWQYKGILIYIEKEQYLGEIEKLKLKNLTTKYFEKRLEERKCELNHENIAKWWSFTTVTCYTIGYGRVTPKTEHGKIMTIIYAIVGIPVSIAMYTSASALATSSIRNSIRYVELNCFQKRHVKYLHGKTVFISFLLFLAFFFTLAYWNTLHDNGSLSLIDSSYYWFQTLTTIGYGDVYPQAEHNDLVENILRVSQMFGLGMTASFISSISRFFHEIDQNKVRKLLSFTRKSWTLSRESLED